METLQNNQFGAPVFIKPKRERNWIWITLAIVIALGWGVFTFVRAIQKGGGESDQAMAHFHQQMDVGDCAGIYSEASPELRTTTKSEEWTSMCEGLKTAMGTYTSTNRGTVNLQKTTAGSFVEVSYESQFSNGPAHESFLWKRDGTTLRLHRYNINSPVLLKNLKQ